MEGFSLSPSFTSQPLSSYSPYSPLRLFFVSPFNSTHSLTSSIISLSFIFFLSLSFHSRNYSFKSFSNDSFFFLLVNNIQLQRSIKYSIYKIYAVHVQYICSYIYSIYTIYTTYLNADVHTASIIHFQLFFVFFFFLLILKMFFFSFSSSYKLIYWLLIRRLQLNDARFIYCTYFIYFNS